MSVQDRPAMPPVRLPSEAELAREALAAPLFARAVRLARWAADGVPVGVAGELMDGHLKDATLRLGLAEESDGPALAADAWSFAVESGLVETGSQDDGEGEGEGAAEDGAAVAVARPGPGLDRVAGGSPEEILRLWEDGLEAVLADAAAPGFEDLLGNLDGVIGEDGSVDTGALDLDSVDWDPEEEGGLLDAALGNLYLLSAGDEEVAAGGMVPLPVLAMSLAMPEEMDEPSTEVLDAISAVMMRLDELFLLLTPTGLMEYDPVDETLGTEEEPPPAPDADPGEPSEPGEPGEEDLSRYGQVRLTPLGVHAVRRRLAAAGIGTPAVGDLARGDAAALLAALPSLSESLVREETDGWLARRAPGDGLRELLAAARGDDPAGPVRRLGCQLALSLTGTGAEPVVREVLDDPELGGLARVWLAERGIDDVPAPSMEAVFWLAVDTLAAQLRIVPADEEEPPEELVELVVGLVDQHSGFFDRAWRVDHPDGPDVLEAMSRIHPDRQAAKAARRAAFKARSRR
ncbi:hypothetical protein [Streptomyces aidingensis]|uniref:Uncharacterized protein n=1 Tax=Streptomyces aidingensis TaxID=910347 RepID=A0A1I1M4Y5_9ACTN|nr:hypothetical protein [Streptomyces aidingensis]SFC80424.1 hypothetical protein SAMN05421773_106102 [Streptomyces aidingensis]